jgi:phosphoribosylaminoimidazole-succinocarboxamide synthase
VNAILTTDLPFPKRSGKVRDVYDVSDLLAEPALLIVASDRISAFDVIMSQGIPDKGAILTAISNFWFEHHLPEGVRHHLIAGDVADFPAPLKEYASVVHRRAILARKTAVIPFECVVRGYLAGSGWKEYQKSQSVCGVKLPSGLVQCAKLPEPVFTPATKAESGHDLNVSFDAMAAVLGEEKASRLRELSLSIYAGAAAYAAERGILIADTKFEFGIDAQGRITLIDEALTPDSSRFWPAQGYESGHDQPSYDKQFLRNWLEAQPWDKTAPAPTLPQEVIDGTRLRYVQAYEQIAGERWR